MFALPPAGNATDRAGAAKGIDKHVCVSDSESSDGAAAVGHSWHLDIANVDIKSPDFISLPPEIQYEILTDMQEHEKTKSRA